MQFKKKRQKMQMQMQMITVQCSCSERSECSGQTDKQAPMARMRPLRSVNGILVEAVLDHLR